MATTLTTLSGATNTAPPSTSQARPKPDDSPSRCANATSTPITTRLTHCATNTAIRCPATSTRQLDQATFTPLTNSTSPISVATQKRQKSQRQALSAFALFQVEYNINHCPLSPYVSYEFSNNLADGMDLEKTRLQVAPNGKSPKSTDSMWPISLKTAPTVNTMITYMSFQ